MDKRRFANYSSQMLTGLLNNRKVNLQPTDLVVTVRTFDTAVLFFRPVCNDLKLIGVMEWFE